MKKWINLMFAFVIALSVLSGCQGSKEKPADTATPSTTDDQSTTETPTTSETTDSAQKTYAEEHLAEWPELHLKAVMYMQTGNFAPTEDVLTPIWREKTKVIPENVLIQGATSITQGIQQWMAAGNLPQVFTNLGTGQGTDAYKLLKTNNKLREVTKEDIKKYMPRFTAWLEEMGGTVDQWYGDNIDPEDGKLWQVPMNGGIGLPGYVGTRAYEETSMGMAPYYMFVRDDILKKVFPEAKTEAELVELYKQQGGSLTYDQLFGDIPINNKEDLLSFFRSVKDLNLTVNGKPIYAQLQSSSQNLNSTLWSMYSINGFLWSFTGERVPKGPELTYTPITPEWKDYYKWWNTIYNEKLVDPETFIQKDDQMNAKYISGQYYTINQWGPVADARKYAKEKGLNYGYRVIPYFKEMSVVNKYMDMRPRPNSLDGNFGAMTITTEVTDEQFPQVLNWFDWNMSKEAAELRTWGLPEWSEGTGADRRFKPEYQAVADWAAYGIASEKDGNYYGLYDVNTNASVGAQRWNPETYGVLGLVYKDAPRYVYPPKTDGEINLDTYTYLAMDNYIREQSIFYHQSGFTWAQLDPDGKFQEIDNKVGVYTPAAQKWIIKMFTGSPNDFDKNWDGYMSNYNDEWHKAFADQQAIWKDIYNNHILPELQKDPKWTPAE